MNKFWFTSDLHFFHKNIVKFTDRNLVTDAENHTEWLIELWNKTVHKSDVVYHLGDFSFSKNVNDTINVINRLNGNIHLIKGNHDRTDNFKKLGTMDRVSTHQYLEKSFTIEDENFHVVMFHFPIASWHKQHHGSWHLHGHSHGSYLDGKGKILDVGLDNSYNLYGEHKFFDLEMIKDYMQKQQVHIAENHRSYNGR